MSKAFSVFIRTLYISDLSDQFRVFCLYIRSKYIMKNWHSAKLFSFDLFIDKGYQMKSHWNRNGYSYYKNWRNMAHSWQTKIFCSTFKNGVGEENLYFTCFFFHVVYTDHCCSWQLLDYVFENQVFLASVGAVWLFCLFRTIRFCALYNSVKWSPFTVTDTCLY